MANTAYVLLVCFFMVFTSAKEHETVVVNTPLGSIRGLRVTLPETGDIVNEFRGIRYGKSTGGSLRFRKPEPFGEWQGEYDGTKFAPACPQPRPPIPEYLTIETSEDCLALNLYVPVSMTRNKKMSVMIYIHGGGLIFGHSHQYDGKRMATEGNVIVVTINYRLSILGFLALDHQAARGNYGIWDQKLALQWVHDNIGAFGGDPASVTIFGESAGGFSVTVQTLIPSNKGLFKRAIMQSGALDFGRMELPSRFQLREKARVLAERTNCVVDELEEFVNCLREKSTEELLKAANDFGEPHKDNKIFIKTFVPSIVVDHELFEDNPLHQLRDPTSDVAQFFKSVKLIGGTTNQEGSLLLSSILPSLQTHYGFNITEGIPCTFLCEAIIDQYVRDYFGNDQDIKTTLCDPCNAKDVIEKQTLKVMEIYGDLLISMPVIRLLEHHSSLGGVTWHYVFSKQSPVSFGGPFPDWFKGAAHADELIFMFPSGPLLGVFNVTFTKEEHGLSKKLIQYWTSFAKVGVPYAGENVVEWSKFTTKDRRFIEFDTRIKSKRNWALKRVKLWNDIIDLLNSKLIKKTTHSEL